MAVDYWQDAKRDGRAAARRIGASECNGCGAKVWNNAPRCLRCDTENRGYEPPKSAKPKSA